MNLFKRLKQLKLPGGSYEFVSRDLSKEVEDGQIWGYIDLACKEVHIHDKLSPSVACKTLLHEASHDILHESGMSSLLAENDMMLEESLCDIFGFGFLRFIKDNPEVVRCIMELQNSGLLESDLDKFKKF